MLPRHARAIVPLPAGNLPRSLGPEVPLNPTTTLTGAGLDRITDKFRSRLETDEAFAHIRENAQDMMDELEQIYDEKWLSAGSYISRKQNEEILIFLVRYCFVLRGVSVPNPPATVEHFLARPPQVSLVSHRGFWKLVCEHLSLRSARYINSLKGKKKSQRTVFQTFILVCAAYTRMTGLKVDRAVWSECVGYIQTHASNHVNKKPIASIENLRDIAIDGIFGINFVAFSGRERLQQSAFMFLMASTAARPGEILQGRFQSDMLRWKDVDFRVQLEDPKTAFQPSGQIKPDAPLRFGVAVTLRNLKGMRADAAAYRTQPIYSSIVRLAPCTDAAFMLAVLGYDDDIFALGVDPFETLVTMSREHFQNNPSNILPLHQDPAKGEWPVFRKVKKQKGKGDTTFETTSQAWTVADASYRLKQASLAAGFYDFVLYALRRLAANLLDRTDITEDNRNATVGHHPNVKTFYHSYMSKRSIVDVLGLLFFGEEDRDALVADGLQRLSNQFLTPEELAEVDALPTVAQHKAAYDKAKSDYEAACSATDADGERITSLRKEMSKHQQRHSYERAHQRSRKREQVAQRLLAEGHAAIARGEPQSVGPAEAKKALVAAMRINDDDDNEGVDAAMREDEEMGHDDEDGAQAPKDQQTEDWVKSRSTEIEKALVDEALQGLGEDDFADVDLDAEADVPAHHAVAQISEEAASVSQSAAHNEGTLPAVEPSQNLATRLQAKLSEAQTECSQFGKVHLPAFDTTLVTNVVGSSVHPKEVAKALLVDDGTKKGNAAAITDLGNCPVCRQPLKDILKADKLEAESRQATVTLVNKHIYSCNRDVLKERYVKAICDALRGQTCPHEKCVAKGGRFGEEKERILRHLDNHWNTVKYLLHCRCIVDGEQCTYQAPEQDRQALIAHQEEVHGIPSPEPSMVMLCKACRTICFGAQQLRRHYQEQHIAKVVVDGRVVPSRDAMPFFLESCPVCLLDETKAPGSRAHVFRHRSDRNTHFVIAHFYLNESDTFHCPYCLQDIRMCDAPEHLLADHNDCLCNARNRPDSIGYDFDLLTTVYNRSRDLFFQWKARVSRQAGILDNEGELGMSVAEHKAIAEGSHAAGKSARKEWQQKFIGRAPPGQRLTIQGETTATTADTTDQGSNQRADGETTADAAATSAPQTSESAVVLRPAAASRVLTPSEVMRNFRNADRRARSMGQSNRDPEVIATVRKGIDAVNAVQWQWFQQHQHVIPTRLNAGPHVYQQGSRMDRNYGNRMAQPPRPCAWCCRDTEYSVATRTKLWNVDQYALHHNPRHIFLLRGKTQVCPECNQTMLFADLFAHMEEAHDYRFCATRNRLVEGDVSRLEFAGEENRNIFLRYAAAGFPDKWQEEHAPNRVRRSNTVREDQMATQCPPEQTRNAYMAHYDALNANARKYGIQFFEKQTNNAEAQREKKLAAGRLKAAEKQARKYAREHGLSAEETAAVVEQAAEKSRGQRPAAPAANTTQARSYLQRPRGVRPPVGPPPSMNLLNSNMDEDDDEEPLPSLSQFRFDPSRRVAMTLEPPRGTREIAPLPRRQREGQAVPRAAPDPSTVRASTSRAAVDASTSRASTSRAVADASTGRASTSRAVADASTGRASTSRAAADASTSRASTSRATTPDRGSARNTSRNDSHSLEPAQHQRDAMRNLTPQKQARQDAPSTPLRQRPKPRPVARTRGQGSDQPAQRLQESARRVIVDLTKSPTSANSSPRRGPFVDRNEYGGSSHASSSRNQL